MTPEHSLKVGAARSDITTMLLSIDQFADRIGVHPSTLRRWLKAGGHLPKPLPVKAIGGGPLWRECDVQRWRDEQIRGERSAELPGAEVPSDGEAPSPRARLIVVR